MTQFLQNDYDNKKNRIDEGSKSNTVFSIWPLKSQNLCSINSHSKHYQTRKIN